MGFELKIEKSTGSIPIFQRDHENAQGSLAKMKELGLLPLMPSTKPVQTMIP